MTPTIAIPSGLHQLTFKNLYNMEFGFDGMVLEISINGGAFSDIITAGGTFVLGGYNATISTQFGSPIGGRQAWSGLSGGTVRAPAYITTKVNLPAAASGQPIQLKWRAATDSGGAATGASGVRIDDVSVDGAFYVCCGAGAASPTPTRNANANTDANPDANADPNADAAAHSAFNLSTRMRVLTDANVGIGGFIVTGTAPEDGARARNWSFVK